MALIAHGRALLLLLVAADAADVHRIFREAHLAHAGHVALRVEMALAALFHVDFVGLRFRQPFVRVMAGVTRLRERVAVLGVIEGDGRLFLRGRVELDRGGVMRKREGRDKDAEQEADRSISSHEPDDNHGHV